MNPEYEKQLMDKYPIWKKHEYDKCDGNWRIMENNFEDGTIEFECDKCRRKLAITEANEVRKIRRELKEKLIES